MNEQETPKRLTKKRSIRKKAQKVIATQDNRFVYAKYDMKTNELKFFMWIVAQINSQKDKSFQKCQIPISDIFQVFNQQSDENYTYIKKLIDGMAKKVYIEDFKLLDETTMKEVEYHRAMPLFQLIQYKKGEAYISYKLNESLAEYLLDLQRNFTQLKFDDIQQMKSAYSIRIYNILLCELKQNKQNLKINLSALQNVLEVPRTLQEYKHFRQKVLQQAQKDINTKSNLVLLDVKTYKTGRKITDLEFIFDYKNNDKRIQREKDRKRAFNKILINKLESYLKKNISTKTEGILVVDSWGWKDPETKENLVINLTKKDGDKFCIDIKDYSDIETIEKGIQVAEQRFYLDIERVKQSKEIQKQLKQGKPDKIGKKTSDFKTMKDLILGFNPNKFK